MDETKQIAFSRALVALMKNPVNKDTDPQNWDTIIEQRFSLGDYVSKMGLEMVVDEIDGYAHLRQRNYTEGEDEIPRIIPRHPLSYPVSLLLILLRKKLLELDTSSEDNRLILTKQQIIEMMQMFLKDQSNEAKVVNDIGRHIDKIKEMGFLRRFPGTEDVYEVQRILRSFINAAWMNDVNEKLETYRSEEQITQDEEFDDQ
jgi:hypothetical protein